MTYDIEIRDVSPRDGLQDLAGFVSTDVKAALVRRLAQVGVGSVEITSFVSPKVVPQLADAADVARQVVADRAELGTTTRLSAFVGTSPWVERALASDLDELSMAVPATDGMSQANFRRDTDTMVREAAAMRAHASGTDMSATVAVAFGCPFDGAVPLGRVLALATQLHECGYDRIFLGDTIGVADPGQVRTTVAALVQELPAASIGVHFHDSRGAGVANVVTAVEAGATLVDASLAGIGGCPFAPGAAGNVALEDVVWVLEALGVHTGIDREAVTDAARWFAETLSLPLSSKTPRHRLFAWERSA